MQVIIGLGNPGEQYEKTRHNAGCMVLDELARTLQLSWGTTKKIHAQTAKSAQVLLVKPVTFMNDSGKAVRAALEYFAVESSTTGQYPTVWVAFDDLDLELGTYKIQFGTGPKVHNGLQSLYQHLGTTEFWHVRLGIDGRGGNRLIPGREYVLQQFSPAEKTQVEHMLCEVATQLRQKVF